MDKAKLYGVGVGPGDRELITVKAVRVIKECGVITAPLMKNGGKTAYDIAAEYTMGKRFIELEMPMSKDFEELDKNYGAAADVIETELKAGNNVAFLTLGDPTVYSTYMRIDRIMRSRGYETEIIPGITSFCAAAARLNMALCERDEAMTVIPASYDIEKSLLENIIDYDMMNEVQVYKFDNLAYEGYGFKTYGPLLTTTNIKTDLLKRANFKLSEKKPYVDMEFNSFSLKYVNTIKFYDLDIYRYLIGRAGQTISREAWKKKYRDHAAIIFRILSVVENDDEFSLLKKKYIYEHIIAQMVDSQIFMYDVALAWNEIDGFLSKLQQYTAAYTVSMEYIEKKQGNCQLILRKYKNYRGDKPIIIPGVYETIFDDERIGLNLSANKGIKYYIKKALKGILPYGIVKAIVQKR